MWSIIIPLRVIYTIAVDFHTFEGEVLYICGNLYICGFNKHHTQNARSIKIADWTEWKSICLASAD